MFGMLLAAARRARFHRLLLAMGIVVCLLTPPAVAQAAGDTTATPAAQALKIYQALRDQDYRALFHLLAFTAKGQATLTTAEDFARDVRAGYDSGFKTPEEKAISDRILASISGIMIGEPVITGNKAAIPTSARITVKGQTLTFRGMAHLIKDKGVWKLDLTFDEDSEKTMAQRTGELIGSPE